MKWLTALFLVGISCFHGACAQRASLNPPDSAIAHFNWGIDYANRGELDQAITEFKLAIKRDVRWAKPYYNLGVAYSKKEKWNHALVAWKKTVYIDPNYANAHYNLARAYARGNQRDLSLTHLRQAVSLDKKFFEAAQSDQNFDTIRKSEEFQEFMRSNR
ncbi:MAG: tetratricopeptide repeat protein [Candidatus Poribacteria bacterium]|nr:tetratricopeptide repeat protein [Candidatus Poribacteria bacterium]MDE0504805.1 tetratricopeptide repeat protein [Candidatus Poribacteria bacterium]